MTGGSSGIGAALAEALVQKGAEVYSLDIQEPTTRIDHINYIVANLTIETEVESAIKQLPEDIGILILNAGVMRRGTIFASSEEDYDLLMDTNLKGAWLTLKHAKPKLKPDATIVQMSSGHALHPEANPGIYTITKKAVTAMAEALALTCPEFDVKVVYPGPVLTPLLLEGRDEKDKKRIAGIGQKPELIARKIVELIESSHKSLMFVRDTNEYVFK